MSDWANTKITCVCGGVHTNKNKTQHIKTKKHLAYVKSQQETPLAILKAKLLKALGEDVFVNLANPNLVDEGDDNPETNEYYHQADLEDRACKFMTDDDDIIYEKEKERLEGIYWPIEREQIINRFNEEQTLMDKRNKFDINKVPKKYLKKESQPQTIELLRKALKGVDFNMCSEKVYDTKMPLKNYLSKLLEQKLHNQYLDECDIKYGYALSGM